MINMTQSAVNAVRTAIEGAKDPIAGLRIMVESGGCAGLKYKMGLVLETEQSDLAIELSGVKVFIDPASVPYLDGTTVDFVIWNGRLRLRVRQPPSQVKLLLRQVVRLTVR